MQHTINSRGPFYTKSRSPTSLDWANDYCFTRLCTETYKIKKSLAHHSLCSFPSQRLKLSQKGARLQRQKLRSSGPGPALISPSSAPRSRRAWTSAGRPPQQLPLSMFPEHTSRSDFVSTLADPLASWYLLFCPPLTAPLIFLLPPISPEWPPRRSIEKTKWVIIRTEQERTEGKKKKTTRKKKTDGLDIS